VRLLELPQGEDPDTWCLKLGGEAFRDLLRAVPDWTAFMVDRAMEGKDLRRITDRMGAFKDLLDFLPYLPRTTESRDLFASLAYQLQVPIQELDRAVRGRKPAAPEPEEAAPELPGQLVEVDPLIRELIRYCLEGAWPKIQQSPAAWWESLAGAPMLQAVLDAEGVMTFVPDDALAIIRRLEAENSQKHGQPDLDRVLAKLECQYLEREQQANNRLYGDPQTQTDPNMKRRIETRQEELRQRLAVLKPRLRAARQ
jgi:DNA primase